MVRGARSNFECARRRVDGACIALGALRVLHLSWFGTDRFGCGLRRGSRSRSYVHAAQRLFPFAPALGLINPLSQVHPPLDGPPSRRTSNGGTASIRLHPRLIRSGISGQAQKTLQGNAIVLRSRDATRDRDRSRGSATRRLSKSERCDSGGSARAFHRRGPRNTSSPTFKVAFPSGFDPLERAQLCGPGGGSGGVRARLSDLCWRSAATRSSRRFSDSSWVPCSLRTRQTPGSPRSGAAAEGPGGGTSNHRARRTHEPRQRGTHLSKRDGVGRSSGFAVPTNV